VPELLQLALWQRLKTQKWSGSKYAREIEARHDLKQHQTQLRTDITKKLHFRTLMQNKTLPPNTAIHPHGHGISK